MPSAPAAWAGVREPLHAVGHLDDRRKGRRGRWVSVPPDLFTAVIDTLPPREDRRADQPVFPGVTQERLRTAIARACKAPARRPGRRTICATAESASGI